MIDLPSLKHLEESEKLLLQFCIFERRSIITTQPTKVRRIESLYQTNEWIYELFVFSHTQTEM
jgi:hypothetical protein